MRGDSPLYTCVRLAGKNKRLLADLVVNLGKLGRQGRGDWEEIHYCKPEHEWPVSRLLYWSTVTKMTPAISPLSFFTLQVKGFTQSYLILKLMTSCYNSRHSVTVHLHSRNWVQTQLEISAVLYSELLVNIKTQKQSKENRDGNSHTFWKYYSLHAAPKFGNKDTASGLFNLKKQTLFPIKANIF